MRFFTADLWQDINNTNEETRKQAEKTWEINCNRYQHEFERVKKYLPRCFVNEFLNRNGLHDYIISEICIKKQQQNYSCQLILTNTAERILIILSNLQSLVVGVNSFECCVLGELIWGYSEFEITQQKNIHLSVLCDVHNELQFEFKKIELQTIF